MEQEAAMAEAFMVYINISCVGQVWHGLAHDCLLASCL